MPSASDKGHVFDGRSRWTTKHIKWLHNLEFKNPVLQETLSEYLVSYNQLSDKVERFDKRIEEFAQQESYREKVNQLVCFKGIKTHTALSFEIEIGDFKRFPTAKQFSAFLGLVPKEHSSADSRQLGSITKVGNSHLRRLLVESANWYSRVRVRRKTAALKKTSWEYTWGNCLRRQSNDRLRR